jgi:transcription elongation factor GreA
LRKRYIIVTGTFLTPEGAEKVKAELENLKTVKRQELAVRLRDAKLMGDLSENADWIMAKEDQAFLEGRIQELEAVLRNATITAASDGLARDRVAVGCAVIVREPGEAEEVFTLVGAKEADPRSRKVSNESPIGRALLGKRVGDKVKVETPGGGMTFEILKIEG